MVKAFFGGLRFLCMRAVVIAVVLSLAFTDVVSFLLNYVPLEIVDIPSTVSMAEAAPIGGPAIRIESFDQDVTTDGSTFSLNFDVGATSSAFIRMMTGTRKTSAGPTGSTGNTAPDVGTVGLVLSDTATVTVERASSTEVKVIGEVWRYIGAAGGGNEFIVRDRVEVNLSGSSVSTAISGITDVDKVVPFVTGYTVNAATENDWEDATIAAHMNDSGSLVVSRNNSGVAATVYVDIVEFTGGNWTVCHGYSNNHDTTEQTITLNTDSDGQGGSTCDVTDWSTATIIEATMEGDSGETGLSDTLALLRPAASSTDVIFDLQQDSAARNDGEAWIHVLQNDDMVVNRASSTSIAEGNGTYGTASWPSGATTTAPTNTLGLEWFSDTTGTGVAHMRGGLHARITDGSFFYNDGDTVNSTEYDSTLEANFESEVTFTSTPSGVIYEAGGTGTGAFVGYNDSGDFIIRAGSGVSTAPADAARIVITTSEYDFSNRTGTLEWNFYPATESVDLSFDEDSNGSIDYSTSTTAASAWANWSGGNLGYVGNSNGNIAGSEITSGYDFDGTIGTVTFTQGSAYEVQHWIHRSGNDVGVDYGIIELSELAAITEPTFVSATSSQRTSVDITSVDTDLGGKFIITELAASRNVTDITLTESGTVDGANGLDNIEIWYDLSTTSPYNCTEHSYDGNETQYGSTDTNGFSGANGVSSFTDTVGISTTETLCGYVVYDVTASSTDGETVDIGIADPSSDVSVSGGATAGPASEVGPAGSTTLRNAELTLTHYRWLEDDGAEGSATAVEDEDTPTTGFANGTVRRLRMQVDAAGSTSSLSTTFQLDYATKTAACNVLSESAWVDVGRSGSGGDWDMSASTFITDGNDATNIGTGNGGVSDPSGPPTFLTINGGLRDINSTTSALTLAADEFVEFEFAIEPTTNAPEGTTYCFRLSNEGSALRNYTTYAEGSVSADIDVSASSSQVTSLDAGSTGQYVGGAFVVERDGGDRTLTDITITETGTVDADALPNVTLYYDIDSTSPYDCTGESYSGAETSIAGTAFSGLNGSSTFSSINETLNNTNSFCGYIVFDVAPTTTNGETIDIEISNPSVDVVVTSSSVGPSSAVSPTGSTTIAGPVLTQTGYHWRNDDGDQSDGGGGATSATGGSENTVLLDVPKNSTRRLRLAVSNEGTVTSGAEQYTIEYGTKITSCDEVGSWQDVEVGTAFQMASTSQLVDGNDTTNIAIGSGGITDPNSIFESPNGGQKENTSFTGNITLATTDFVELEYAIAATDESGFDTTYCFRVTASGTPLLGYDQYPELTTREKQDFFIQRGTVVISGTATTVSAGTDYTAPAATTSAFVRISGAHMTGAANDLGTDGQEADDVTAYISDQSDITTGFTISRPPSATSNTRVDWEIIEYVGPAGADNEMIVRSVGEESLVSTEFYATSSTATVSDDNDVVVFITGQQNRNAGTGEYNDSLFTATWHTTSSVPVLERGDADVSADVSYAVVEFTGLNWNIQRIEHTYTLAGTTEAEPMATIGLVSRAFVHAQKRVGEGLSSIDEGGHLVWISSLGAVSFQLRDTAQTPADHVSVAWVIENTQTGDGSMVSYQSTGTLNDPDPEPALYSVSIGGTVRTSNSTIFGTNHTAGTGTTYPRLHTGFTIASTTHYEIYRSDTNNDMTYRVEVIEWPVAEVAVRQNYYRFYADNDAIDPTDPWPAGATNLGENTSITAIDDPVAEGEVVRIRMTAVVSNASLPELTTTFTLQYAKRDTTCTAISEPSWNDVGAPGSGAIWRGFNASPTDGATVGTTTISLADILGTYEEENDSAPNPSVVDVGEDIEYDWVVQHNGALQRTDYCFRMINSDNTLLAGYNNYPTLRTTGYTPVSANWRWYDDATSTTPTNDMAAENTAPIDVANTNEIKLRVTVAEIENASGNNVKFGLQYSEYSDFSDGGTFLTSTSSCTANSLWCYADGAGVDNTVISTSTLSDADSCSGGVGNGCGNYNESTSTVSSLTQPASSNMEFDFTIQHAGARANAVYYFRLYDLANDDTVLASSTYPSLVTEGASLTFSFDGIASSTVTEGITTDIDTTVTSIDFGSLPLDTELEAAHRIGLDTNGTEGYQVLMYTDGHFVSSFGGTIDPIAASNTSPAAWATGCSVSADGCFGYHAGDDLLSGGSTRFSAPNTYAAFETTPREVAFSTNPVINETHDLIYKVQVRQLQEAGQYETKIIYIAIPLF